MSAPQPQWRSLLEDPALTAEAYPSLASMLSDGPSRRQVLKLMAASMALGGLTGCNPAIPGVSYIPSVIAAPGIVAGEPDHYATASVARGDALGIVVTHQMGRPIKVEGNKLHPASLGSTDALAQALILDFYDPDRSVALMRNGQPAGRQALLTMLAELRPVLAASRGAGLRILSGTVASPTLGAAIGTVLARYPEARWHQHDAISRDAVRQGAAMAYGGAVDVLPRVGAADVILALDSDLLSSAPGHVRHARDFASRRNPARARMSRVYAVEATPGLTGAAADHRFIASAAETDGIVMAFADAVLRGQAPSGAPPWLGTVVDDLKAHQGAALVHAGPDLPAEAHALVHAMNEALGARGKTLDVVDSALSHPPDPGEDLAALTQDMQAGRVSTLLILEENPVYTDPGFAGALKRVKLSIQLAPSLNETGAAATWFVPETHVFETWGDSRAYDGTATIMQPMALPLYGGTSPIELLALLTAAAPTAPIDAVRAQWKRDDPAWQDVLASGVVPATASNRVDTPLKPEAATAQLPAREAAAIELLVRPDPYLWDGRHANNPWLQELPRPLTKLTWDNPVLISPALARTHQLTNGDEIELWAGARSVQAPVWIMPGQAAPTAVALLGFGRRVVGAVGSGAGWDFFPVRDAAGPVVLKKTGRSVPLACTDHHNALDVDPGTIAPIVRHATLAAFTEKPDLLKGERHGTELYRREPGGRVAWGMGVDLNACIGCNACVVACMAENNVPVVGKDQVMLEREMHWLRIDRYWEGDADDPQSFFQPMLCQHCEQAPCEIVCPVGATVHDEEGLNLMVYNRCVGTRFCSNNCPYKVRRFNFLAFTAEEPRSPMSRNTDVSVRARGVMEKCTFCLQRIAQARIAHDRDGVPEQVETACQAACPTRAFTFGDLNKPDSAASARRNSPLDYSLLAERNTHPRVTYEGVILNPNPAIVA